MTVAIPHRKEHGTRQLAPRVGEILRRERNHAEAEKREEGQGNARDDVLERRVGRKRQQICVQIGQSAYRKDRQDGQNDIDNHCLGAGDRVGANNVEEGHGDDQQYRECLRQGLLAVEEAFTGVATERDGHHSGHNRVRRKDQPSDDPEEVTVAVALADVLQQAACRRVTRTELGERIRLQSGDGTRDEKREPHRGAGDLAGRSEQGEDPCAHHRADADECGLSHRESW